MRILDPFEGVTDKRIGGDCGAIEQQDSLSHMYATISTKR